MQRIEKNSLKRVNVVGSSGCGKTTFSKLLASKLNVPQIELDELYWGPNWKPVPDEILFEHLEKALSQENWVLDGNYSRTAPIKWKKVTAVVWLDYSYSRILFQVTRRSLTNIISGRELWQSNRNKETFSMTFLHKDSILLWTLTNLGKIKKQYEIYSTDPGFRHILFYRLRSPGEAQNFLNSI
jgi:adenylate kinase family enzyme